MKDFNSIVTTVRARVRVLEIQRDEIDQRIENYQHYLKIIDGYQENGESNGDDRTAMNDLINS